MHVLEADVTAILAESSRKPVRRRIDWMGHTKSGAMLSRTVDGLGLLSRAPEGDSIAWGLDRQGMIRQRSVLPFSNICVSVTLLGGKLRPMSSADERPLLPLSYESHYRTVVFVGTSGNEDT